MLENAMAISPLNVTLECVYEYEYDGNEYCGAQHPAFIATSPQHPGLSRRSNHRDHPSPIASAIDRLVGEILDSQPLARALVDRLVDAGYSHDLVEEWAKYMRGDELRQYRHSVHLSLAALQQFADLGVPAASACRYIAFGIDAATAAEVQVAGGTPEEARKWACKVVPRDVGKWIASGVSRDRCGCYLREQVPPATAGKWEEVVREHHISDRDLNDVLRAGFTPESVAANVADYRAAGMTIGDAARTQIALAGPRDPWAGSAEPPF